MHLLSLKSFLQVNCISEGVIQTLTWCDQTSKAYRALQFHTGNLLFMKFRLLYFFLSSTEPRICNCCHLNKLDILEVDVTRLTSDFSHANNFIETDFGWKEHFCSEGRVGSGNELMSMQSVLLAHLLNWQFFFWTSFYCISGWSTSFLRLWRRCFLFGSVRMKKKNLEYENPSVVKKKSMLRLAACKTLKESLWFSTSEK